MLHVSDKVTLVKQLCREKVYVPASKPYISFIGNQNQTSETVITWNNKASDIGPDGCELGTYKSASVTIESDYFCASAITFQVSNQKKSTLQPCKFLGFYSNFLYKLLASKVISLISVPQNSVVYVPGGYGMQAVALRISGDKAMFYGVRILGTQDTLLDDSGSHYFYRSYIQGSVDFIFGRSRSLYRVIIFYAPSYI